ncbi:hypothetical protein HYQ46_004214 [Verticillium longisporum]|nr:hypothetical protein HYQ46_004214 [Verticillium longisporum]
MPVVSWKHVAIAHEVLQHLACRLPQSAYKFISTIRRTTHRLSSRNLVRADALFISMFRRTTHRLSSRNLVRADALVNLFLISVRMP